MPDEIDDATRRHADALRRALAAAQAERGPAVRQEIMAATGKGYRTINNWISPKKPTMPDAVARVHLRRILGPYAEGGDAVESAIRRSELHEWRQNAVLGEYQRHLYEQRREVAG